MIDGTPLVVLAIFIGVPYLAWRDVRAIRGGEDTVGSVAPYWALMGLVIFLWVLSVGD